MTAVRRLLSIGGLWVAITLAAAFIGPASTPIALPDVLWSLLRGQWMLEHRRLLETDPFTSAPHVPGPLVNVQWFADILFASLAAIGGLPMVITGTAVVVALTYGLLLAATVIASGHLRLSCVSVWCAYVLGASNLPARPQTLSYPLFVLFLLAMVRLEWRKDSRLLWCLPLATVIWVNLHGSFFTGLLLLGAAAMGRILGDGPRTARPYFLTLAACVVASFINPYGPGALSYVFEIGNNQIIRQLVSEWAPTTVDRPEGILFFASLAVIAGLALRSRVRLTPVEMVVLTAFACLAWSSVRAIVWWGLVLAPTLARVAAGALPIWTSRGRDRPLVNAIVLAVLAAVVFISLPWNKSMLPLLPAAKRGVFSDGMPIGVATYLQTHDPPAPGLMFVHQPWGGYLEWATWPRHQVFVDGRIELHPDQVWRDYLEIIFPSVRWRALLDQYGIGYAVLDNSADRDLIAALRDDAAWRVTYSDDQATVFARNEG